MTIQRQHSGIMGLNPTINQKDNPYAPGSDLYKLQGWQLSESLSITKRKGFQKLNQVQLIDAGDLSAFTGLFELIFSTGAQSKKITTTTKGLYVFDTPIQGVWNSISLSGVGGIRTGNFSNLYAARVLFDQLYIGGGGSTDLNIRFDGTNAYKMGITAPSSAPTVSAPQAGGSLNPTSSTGYSWVITFANALNQESNPSPVSNSVQIVGGSGNYTVNLSNIPVSSDPQVTKRLIYRTTADGAVWLLVYTINDNTTTTYSDGNADSTLGIAADFFSNGVPPHFTMIEIFQGVAFMAGDPNNKSRIWFSANSRPANLNSNDFRDLDPNDGDMITGLRKFQSTVVATKNYSIWLAIGSDRTTFGFNKQASVVGSVNNASIVEVPGQNKLIFLTPDARFYSFDGVTAAPVAQQLEPILQNINKGKLAATVGCQVPALNQVRWLVYNGSYNLGNLIIWYDYVLDKWGTISINNTKANVIAALHDENNNLGFYAGGITDLDSNTMGGFVWRGDSGGSDDGLPISAEVVDRGHPRYLVNPIGEAINYPTPENIKIFSHLFIWFLPMPNVTLNAYGYIDSPESTPIFIGSVSCNNPSGQAHLHFNLRGRRLYIRIVETSTLQGITLRGWKIYYYDVGRHNAP